MKKNPLLDTEFLKKLYKNKDREIYAKVIALNINEEPVEEITGKITGGSVNVDGASAVRRTCSLTMIADSIDLTDYYWGFKTKIKIFIGLTNSITTEYPSIIWIPLGVYIINTFNTSQSTTGMTVSLSGKDKMCLLNGDISGSIHAYSTRFDIIETTDENGDVTEEKLTIHDIIKEAVHGHAGEPMHNIIINDLDEYGLELLEYRGSEPLGILMNDSDQIEQILLSTDTTEVEWNGELVKFSSLFTEDSKFSFKPLLSESFVEQDKTQFDTITKGNSEYTVSKLEYGNTAGYRLTDLIYPGELIANVGESITGAVLDKIVNTLGNFEYFYDIQGRFVFQKKKNYVNTSWNNLRYGSDKVVYAEAAAYSSALSWSFEGNQEVISLSNTPTLTNLRNDFSIWGTRESVSGAEIPIHLRYAIDKKPTYYKTTYWKDDKSDSKEYYTDGENSVDYRELIYQMALDYRKNNRKDNFISRLIECNPELCARGRTGYEQYYIDMEGFWRQIYNPEPSEDFDSETHWHNDVTDNPSVLNFWIEFLDTDGEISKYSIPAVGDRAKVVNNTSINSIYYKDTPLIIFYEDDEDIGVKSGYTYAKMGSLEDLFSISSQGQSAKDELDSLLYNYAYCTESISLTVLPVYTLEPNTRISVKDDENINVNGEYIVSKITIPLTYNGTMTISASKVPDTIL